MSTAGEDAAARPLPANHMLLRHGRLGALQLANRILMAPMARTRAAFEGTPSELMAEYYAQRASSGLIISEGTFPPAVGRTYLNQPGLHSDAHQTGWARVTDKVHAAGGRILVQLEHSGRISHPDVLFGLTPVSPSEVRPAGMEHTADGKKRFASPAH